MVSQAFTHEMVPMMPEGAFIFFEAFLPVLTEKSFYCMNLFAFSFLFHLQPDFARRIRTFLG